MTQPHNSLPAWNRAFGQAVLLLFLMVSFCSQSSLFAEKEDKELVKHFGLIFGTAYGPDDRPLYGAKIEIHPVGQKKPHWERFSDHRGEFTLRVPPGPGDYLVTGEADVVLFQDGKPQQKKRVKAERTVHIQGEEREDIGLHLAE